VVGASEGAAVAGDSEVGAVVGCAVGLTVGALVPGPAVTG